MNMTCPFCGHHPFEYVDIGVGQEPVAVTCCVLGDLYFRGARPVPETIEIAWEDFEHLGNTLAQLRHERHVRGLNNDYSGIATMTQTNTELVEAAINAVPGNWCDPLLSGDGVPPLPWGCPEIERLLNAVRDRVVTALQSNPDNIQEGGK